MNDATPFAYAEYPPTEAEAAAVRSYWQFTSRLAPGVSRTHHVWPDGCVSVVVILRPDAAPIVTGSEDSARAGCPKVASGVAEMEATGFSVSPRVAALAVDKGLNRQRRGGRPPPRNGRTRALRPRSGHSA